MGTAHPGLNSKILIPPLRLCVSARVIKTEAKSARISVPFCQNHPVNPVDPIQNCLPRPGGPIARHPVGRGRWTRREDRYQARADGPAVRPYHQASVQKEAPRVVPCVKRPLSFLS